MLKVSKKNILYCVIVLILVCVCIAVSINVNKHSKKENSNNNDSSRNFVETTKEEKEKYEITSRRVDRSGNTVVLGTVKNNSGVESTIQVRGKMYDENGELVIVSQTLVEGLKADETKEFEIEFMGNYMENNYTVEAEYIAK